MLRMGWWGVKRGGVLLVEVRGEGEKRVKDFVVVVGFVLM